MVKKEYNWKYDENDCQKYYDTYNGSDYLCVYANKAFPDIWMGMYEVNKCFVTVMDKTFNNKQRKKGSPVTKILSSSNPEYIKKKLIWAYEHNLYEVSK